MKKTLILCGAFGLVGVVGLLLGSQQLMAFLLFFLLFLLIPIKTGDDFDARAQKAIRRSFVLGIFLFATAFLFSALLSKLPMIVEQMQFDVLLLILIQGLSGCFILMLAAFVVQVLIAALASSKKNR